MSILVTCTTNPICVHYCVIFYNFVDGVQRALSVCTYTGCDVTNPGSTCPALAHRHHEEDEHEEEVVEVVENGDCQDDDGCDGCDVVS